MRVRAGRGGVLPRMVAALAVAATVLCAPEAGAQQDEAGVAPGPPAPDVRPGEAFADPAVAELQRTATDVQRELDSLAGQIHVAETDVATASVVLAEAKQRRADADAVVAARQSEVDAYTSAVFRSLGRPNQIQVLLTARSPNDFLDGASLMSRVAEAERDRLGAALDRQRGAIDAEQAAATAEQAARDRKSDLDRRNADASNRAAAVSGEFRGKLAATNEAVIAQQKAQRERNERTAANWRAYLGRLAEAGIRAPAAASLVDPARFPPGLSPLPGAGGRPQAGVAEATLPTGQRLLVLPSETIAAVTAAVDALGKPYVPRQGGEGPTAYSCDGLVRSAYGGGGIGLPVAAGEQLAVLPQVPAADAQPGDLVFVGPARYGVQSVGLVLDQRTMLAADGRLAGVVVTDLPAGDSLLAIARPALPHHPPVPVPQRTDGGLEWRCGGVIVPPTASGPMAWGGYPNGLIPPAALCTVSGGAHLLRCDAAQAYEAMSTAFAAAFGRRLCITDSYRTFEAQIRLYAAKPALAAVPGTSNHGWGLAVDLCGGVQSYGTPEYAWLAGAARAFGWVNPPWAQPGRGREEPWHWEYIG
jgi:cell wall-associated NlpC family hydrolase